MESVEKSPEPAKSGGDGTNKEENASGDRGTESAAEKPGSPKIGSCDKDDKPSPDRASVSLDKEKLPSPEAASEEISHPEKSEELSSREEPKEAEDPEKNEASKDRYSKMSEELSSSGELQVAKDSEKLGASIEKESLSAPESGAASETPAKEASAEELPVPAAEEPPAKEASAEEPPVPAAEEPPAKEASAEEPPVPAAEEPPVSAAEKPPVSASDEPQISDEEEPPVSDEEEPPISDEEEPPVTAKELPVPAAEPPVSAEEEAPVSAAEKPPVLAAEPPVSAAETPVSAEEEAPVSAAEPPVSAAETPVSVTDNEENDSSQVDLIENKNNEGKEEGIRPESRSEIVEPKKVEAESTKSSTVISEDDHSSSRPQSSLSNKDLSAEAEKVEEEKSQADDVSGPEGVSATERKSPEGQQSIKDQSEETVEKTHQEASADEPMEVEESADKKASDKKESDSILIAMARADIDNDETGEAMDVSHDESDPLSSAAEKDVEMSVESTEDKNKGCEVEIHTDIVKSEAYQEEDDPKSSNLNKKDKETSKESQSAVLDKTSEKTADQTSKEAPDMTKEVTDQGSKDKTSEEATDKTSEEATDKTSEEATDKPQGDSEKTPALAARSGDDDICIIPDTVPQMMRKKLKEITDKSSLEGSPSDKTTKTSSTETIEDSDEEVPPKESTSEKEKTDLPVQSPRPQRQAAKRAETQIKVLAAVESYEPPEPKPVLTILDNVTETNPCQQCGLVTYCPYKLTSKESYLYFCRELCYKEYTSEGSVVGPVVGSAPPLVPLVPLAPLVPLVPIVGEALSPAIAPASPADLERPFERKCSECSTKVVPADDKMLTWETMDFCNDECLGKYQTALGSHCANCKKAVQNASLGKYCVRFGYDIKQFCCAACLEEFKKGLKVCSYCQKDISSDRGGFLAPVGDKSQFKDFCTQTCMEKYEQMSSSVTPPVPVRKCAVCCEEKPVVVEVLSGTTVHELCGQVCFAAFKFVNRSVADQCVMCKKYFDKAKTENFTIFYDDAPHSFCCKTCMNVYILAKRKIVPCSFCKVKKYNFDMIQKTTSTGQVVLMCSLHCLNLYLGSAGTHPSRRVKCDACSTMVSAQYHLTMSDGTIRNFCSYNCVGVFQAKFSRTAVGAAGKDDVPVPTGGPKRAISRRSMASAETETGGKAAPLPVISSVTSLAPNGEPLPVTGQTPAPLPTTVKVRGPAQRKVPNRELPDLSKPSADTGNAAAKHFVVVRPPHQPQRSNSGVQVKPTVHHKGVSCKPQLCVKETQTCDELGEKKYPIIVPIPVPIYIPAPMCMYSAPAPVPVPFPLPIPVPIFIPTTRNSTKGIMKEIKRIQEKIPNDPFEAEMLMMAEMVAGEKKAGESESEEGDALAEEPSGTDAGNGVSQTFSPEAVDSSNTFGEDIMQMALKLASTLDEQPVDFEAAVAPSTITPGRPHSSAATDDDNSDSDPDDPEAENKRVTRKRTRAASRSSTSASNPSKRSRRISSSESLPVHPPSDGSSTSTRTDVEKADAHTVLKFTYGVNAWRQWVLQKNAQLEKAATSNRKLKRFKTDLLQLTADELNYSLCLFVKEVRKPNGTEYAPDTIYYLCLGIQLYLIENGRVDNIFSDPFFEKFTECLDEISKKFSTLYDDTQYIVTRVEEEHLWEAKQLGAHSPYVLLSTLMFFNTKHFNITTVEEHMMLSFSHIMKHWKRNNNAPGSGKAAGRNVLLRFYPSQAALESNSKKKKVYEQSENEDDPLRCPVKLYEFYLSKCPESVKTRNDLFYLQPERSCVPDSPVWYSTMSLNKETLLKMLRRVKMVKEINVAILK